ncbi:hypothetical protein [Streptomyces sp. NBC_01089]|uniref:hypothetical protein n=1 Tax=Streptomyces sp. NBC_01089 TaxID=2903747 RepID=UPI0038674829|nr:hypothetical protein OG510_29510 [Streptomyces sp. NBC_01089]
MTVLSAAADDGLLDADMLLDADILADCEGPAPVDWDFDPAELEQPLTATATRPAAATAAAVLMLLLMEAPPVGRRKGGSLVAGPERAAGST